MPAKYPPLRDRVGPSPRILFVGINPGIRSAEIGHHFAGPSNRFWKLLYESGLVPEPIGTRDDVRLPEWGYGITNIVARATPGIDTLRPEEYIEGVRILRRKVRRWRPAIVAFVGVTVYRAVTGHSGLMKLGSQRVRADERGSEGAGQLEQFENAIVFVLPNPSGRNANFSYAEMLAAFKSLARFARSTGRADIRGVR